MDIRKYNFIDLENKLKELTYEKLKEFLDTSLEELEISAIFIIDGQLYMKTNDLNYNGLVINAVNLSTGEYAQFDREAKVIGVSIELTAVDIINMNNFLDNILLSRKE